MTRPMAFSFPGMARAESTTVSSGPSLTKRWSSIAIRESAAIGSPCDPVARHSTSCAGIAVDVGVADLRAGGNPQIPEPLGDLRVLHHAAPEERHLAIELRGEVHEDLHPVDARRERGHDQPAGGAGEDLLERFDDFALRSGEAAAVDVGAVGKQRQDARRAELREPVHVEMLAVDRRLIDLEVARVDDDADRRVNGERDAVRARCASRG